MAAAGCALEPDFRRGEVERNASPEAIGLAKIELGIGVAGLRERPPNRDRAGIVGALPGIDAGFDRLRRQRRGDRHGQHRSN